jgi:formamidopyrimidine-DNA glycosylase
MVEGHQVHRTQHQHAKALKGKVFKATSPNARFTEGAAAINTRVLHDVQAVGKNLAYVFTRGGAQAGRTTKAAPLIIPADAVVVRVHFGMAGRHAAFDPAAEPPPTATTRLRLEATDGSVVTHLSAMTVESGGPEVLAGLLSTLGPDPLRSDADPERFWAALRSSRRSVGFELMRQEAIAGVGNIYRAEILHFAGVHPDTPAAAITRPQFEAVWAESVRQMRAGFECGSIITVPPELAAASFHDKAARRVVYNRPRCAKCGGKVVSWDINARTAYACEACQPPPGKAALGGGGGAAAPTKSAPRLFASKCAPEMPALLDGGAGPVPAYLTVPQLRAALAARGVEVKGLLKAGLVARLEREVKKVKAECGAAETPATPAAPAKRVRRAPASPGTAGLVPADADAAAAEKAAAGEGRNVEHVSLAAGDATVWLAKKKGKGKAVGSVVVAGSSTPDAPAKKRGKRAAA